MYIWKLLLPADICEKKVDYVKLCVDNSVPWDQKFGIHDDQH